MAQYRTPLGMLYKWEKEIRDNLYLSQPIDGRRIEYTWRDTGQEVRKMAAYLKSLNLEPGSRIAILSKNCAHWMMSDLAIFMAGHVSVPMYPNLNAKTIRQILEHSETKVAFVGKLDEFEEMRPGIPENIQCIHYPAWPHTGYSNWDDLVKDVEPISGEPDRELEELATIIYTSGTTGMPKGVLHDFHAFGFAAENAVEFVGLDNNTKFFSYLPLCHIAERVLVEMGSFYTGGSVGFAESLDLFPKNLQEWEPTIFLAVPRIWAKFQEGILKKMPQKKLDLFLKIPILSGIVKKKVRAGLGLGNAEHIFSGAAPLPVSLQEWFMTLGIEIQEAYAMTENCCYSHVTMPGKIRIGTVGQQLPKEEVKISDIGEILVKHEAVMKGYYKEPEMTAETITSDGFLRTGDKGEIDADGYLKITGRVKDLFKTSKGKYGAPSPIELKIEANPNVEHVCVVGDGLPQPIALITLMEASESIDHETLAKDIWSTIQSVNQQIDKHENIRKAIVLNTHWTVENGFLTPTMKIKRNVVEAQHKTNYLSWFEEDQDVLFTREVAEEMI